MPEASRPVLKTNSTAAGPSQAPAVNYTLQFIQRAAFADLWFDPTSPEAPGSLVLKVMCPVDPYQTAILPPLSWAGECNAACFSKVLYLALSKEMKTIRPWVPPKIHDYERTEPSSTPLEAPVWSYRASAHTQHSIRHLQCAQRASSPPQPSSLSPDSIRFAKMLLSGWVPLMQPFSAARKGLIWLTRWDILPSSQI